MSVPAPACSPGGDHAASPTIRKSPIPAAIGVAPAPIGRRGGDRTPGGDLASRDRPICWIGTSPPETREPPQRRTPRPPDTAGDRSGDRRPETVPPGEHHGVRPRCQRQRPQHLPRQVQPRPYPTPDPTPARDPALALFSRLSARSNIIRAG